MPRINVTVTATDPGGEVQLAIDQNPIRVPRGGNQHDLVFRLVDRTTQGPTTFNTDDPIFYRDGRDCPNSGKNCDQLDVTSCDGGTLVVSDVNSRAGDIGYRLNFRYANKHADLDPIIQNGGGD